MAEVTFWSSNRTHTVDYFMVPYTYSHLMTYFYAGNCLDSEHFPLICSLKPEVTIKFIAVAHCPPEATTKRLIQNK